MVGGKPATHPVQIPHSPWAQETWYSWLWSFKKKEGGRALRIVKLLIQACSWGWLRVQSWKNARVARLETHLCSLYGLARSLPFFFFFSLPPNPRPASFSLLTLKALLSCWGSGWVALRQFSLSLALSLSLSTQRQQHLEGFFSLYACVRSSLELSNGLLHYLNPLHPPTPQKKKSLFNSLLIPECNLKPTAFKLSKYVQ